MRAHHSCGGPLSDLWCYDVTPRVHQNILVGAAVFIFLQQDPSPDAFHACGLWLLLKKLDNGIGTAYTSPGIASVAVKLGPASYAPADYHENNGWDPVTMEGSFPYPFRAYPIIEIKIFPAKKVRLKSDIVYFFIAFSKITQFCDQFQPYRLARGWIS